MQFDFLHSFIEQLFDENGLAGLTESARAEFVPMFVAEAQRRLGLALMPRLTEKQASELLALNGGAGSEEKLQAFWRRAVPDFDQLAEHTLTKFTDEFKKTLGQTRSS